VPSEVAMTLREKLDAERARRMAIPGVRDAVGETLAELRRIGAGGTALRPGDAFPDFLLPDTDGRLVARDDLLAAGPLVIAFFRGAWCPYCRVMLAALEEALPEIRAAGATFAAVTPETGGGALDVKRRHRAGYAVLADVDSGLAALCGVVFRVPVAYRQLLLRFGIDLAERQGNAAWLLPVPAAFVLDRGGTVAWAHVDADFTRRAEPADIVAALRALG
jgi:peroxiredoxin